MSTKTKRTIWIAGAALAGLSTVIWGARPDPKPRPGDPKAPTTEGSLVRVDKDGRVVEFCPLKHTSVNAEITGFLARVSVTQEFHNPSAERIEAIYKFPLPENAAVDRMDMLIGKREVKGVIKRREEARKIYDDARQRGQTAALLDQERPNIFTQAVANIGPGETVKIHISYVETMKYEDGTYEFVYPMVVGPRYTPLSMTDPQTVVPPRTPEGTRAGHDINVKVAVNAGMAIENLNVISHAADTLKASPSQALVTLRNERTIPNKDFILRYGVAGGTIKDALLTHKTKDRGFFTLILQPPDRVVESEVTPKEIVFVVDTSGSMHGYPMDKVKETIKMAFDGLHPRDTFNLITFSGDEHILFPKPVPATRENIATAWRFMQTRDGRGGTEMMKAIKASLDPSDAQDHVRIVCFMTDGEVGNDLEILGEIQRHPNARVFAFGIGSSVNRFLLDGMSKYGRGETQYVTLTEDGSKAAKIFHERVRTPLLTDIQVDWDGLEVSQLYPARIPDLFSAKPLVLTGQYSGSGPRTIRLKGKVAGRPFLREIKVDFPAQEPKQDVLATLWARRKVEDLMSTDFRGIQYGKPNAEVKEQITQLGLEYRLMTQFTSFVAVEDRVVTDAKGEPRRMEVPVEMPEGVSYEGVYGKDSERKIAYAAPKTGRSIGGFIGGMRSEQMAIAPPPAPPAQNQPQPEKPAKQNATRPDGSGPGDAAANAQRKIHPSLLAARPGQVVKVQVWLTAVNAEVTKRLMAAGLKIAPGSSGTMLTGEIDAALLSKLALVNEVKLIQPAPAD
jgi:Ca-activated chloride channel family protein